MVGASCRRVGDSMTKASSGQPSSQSEAEDVARTTPRWKLLERVAAAIERSVATVDGTVVTPNAKVPERVTGKLRQVDVLVEIPASGRRLRIAMEVRDFATPLSVPQVEGLIAKLAKLDVDKGAIVASSGFAESALAAVVAAGVDALTIQSVELPFWWEARNLRIAQDGIETLGIEWIYGEGADQFHVEHPTFESDWRSVVVEWPSLSRTLPEQIDHDVANILRPVLAEAEEFDKDVIVPIEYQGTGCTFVLNGGSVPLPDLVRVMIHVRRVWEEVPLSAFQREDHLAVTGASETLGRQFTFIVKEVEGGTRLSVSLDDPGAKPVRVQCRSDQVRNTPDASRAERRSGRIRE
jgi:hypothetical protein